MYVAKNKTGQFINLLETSAVPQDGYTCPACGNPVCYKSGKILRPHFAHISLKNCHYWSENESAQHLSLKSHLYHWLNLTEKVELEKPLSAIGQIADLLVNERLVLEVQCSSLSLSRLQERSQSYRTAGYQVLWLLGRDLWLRNHLTELQKQFLYYSQNMGFHLWELDEEKEEIRLRYLIHEDLRGKIHCLTKRFPFQKGKLLHILRTPFQRQALTSLTRFSDQSILQYISQQLYYRTPKWMQLQGEAYQRGENLLNKTTEEFYPQIRLPQSTIGFAQIEHDLTALYTAFDNFYKKVVDKRKQILYPPIVYFLNNQKTLQK